MGNGSPVPAGCRGLAAADARRADRTGVIVVDQDEPESSLEQRTRRKLDPQRRKLELARNDVSRRLSSASDQRLRDMLQRALTDLDEQLRKIGDARGGPDQ